MIGEGSLIEALDEDGVIGLWAASTTTGDISRRQTASSGDISRRQTASSGDIISVGVKSGVAMSSAVVDADMGIDGDADKVDIVGVEGRR